jgi:hypothetical protein
LTPTPTFDEFASLFPLSEDVSSVAAVSPDEMPEPYRGLLVHKHHMTVTVEKHYGSPVTVSVLRSWRDGDIYSRKILLALANSARVVQFGVVRINLSFLSRAVKDEIVAEGTPLGRVLINHKVLRRIVPISHLRAVLGPDLAGRFGVPPGTTTYGRIGVIFTDNQPAIEVLEVLAPI